MRFGALVLAPLLALAACGQPAAPSASTTTATTTTTIATTAASATWFFCDGVDAPTLMLFTGSGETNSTATMTAYDKSAHGAAAAPVSYTVGEGDGAMGSVYYPLQQNGQDAGHVRQANPGMFETPGATYTTPYTSVTFGDKEVRCRWMPRTRLMGFSNRRTFVINEDADGDLIYTTYDFADSAKPPIETSDNGETQAYSVEVRGGHENTTPQGSTYTFTNRGYRYVASVQNGTAQVQVFEGDRPLMTEQMIAFTQGTAAAAQPH